MGYTIRHLREAYPLTQKELAELLSVRSENVSRWERGESRPRPSQIRKMAEIFKLPAQMIDLVELKKNKNAT